ncbi:tetratricopeptide repeat protein [Sphingorhabdus sp. M41]|uniref:tetratricopeptide repeat protein n=1 Tax=Sphingorhabdus sp. M41 TaxID=1806885 RepID=UPI00078B96B8|nr:hypothetical protein [Sphingorhabdus sp. M41]AMO72101.1 hypothetical protein AZE99_09810 [Sphingorhabdus sp. M41]
MPILTEAEKLQLCLERDRLLCSSEFARSPTMSKLLRYLVDHKLQEENTPLTAYSVAVDALGRDDSFDTQIDSYPRVQIGRLRRMLDHFYLREKSESRLFIPYHHYEIILGPNESDREGENVAIDSEQLGGEPVVSSIKTEPPNRGHAGTSRMPTVSRSHVLMILAAIAFLAIAVTYFLQKTDSVTATKIAYPAVVVKTTEGIIDSSSRAKLEMIHSHLVGALEKFDQVRIFDEDADPTQSSRSSQYLLETSNLNDAANRIQLRLVNSATREVIWSSRIETMDSQKRDADLDRAVIAIAGPYGKIAQHELSKYRVDFTPGYPCLLQFHQYMRYQDSALLEPVLQCMDASAQQYPNDSYLMSMVAVAKNLSERFGLPDEIEGYGKDFALRAAKLDNDSASATFAVAQSAFLEGDCRKGVAWGERAVSLNPLNSRIMGYLGMYMLACNMPEGEAYSTRALKMDANADQVVAATVALQKLRRGDAKGAQELSSKYMDSVPGAAPGLEISYILSSAMLGQKEEARKAWRLLAKRSGFPETADPADVLGRWIANPNLVRELESDFRKAKLF